MFLESTLRRLSQLLKCLESAHRPIAWTVQVGAFVASGVGAFLLRFDLRLPPGEVSHLLYALPAWVSVKAALFRLLGLDHGLWRFVSAADVVRLGVANVVASAACALLITAVAPPGFPRSIYLIDFLLSFLALAGVRLLVRLLLEMADQDGASAQAARVLIYGAGAAGAVLLREIRTNAKLPYRVCGFVDDHPGKQGIRIQGVQVWGTGAKLEALVRERAVQEILVAIPSATGDQMTQILERCHNAAVRCRTIPSLAELIREGRPLAQIRDVAVEDLLGRSVVSLEPAQIRARLENKAVLVTGAGGSIGSELCRQLTRFRPAAIVGFEIAENALFHLDREMRSHHPAVPFFACLGNIQNFRRLREVFDRYRPAVVYHAAAYKHVPMMESHIFEAVENNVLGTAAVGRLAREYRVQDFVMISTDKAVHPTSVMGATKRVAELIVRALHDSGTRFVSVRFGNVLGSNGSVIPLFKEQIARGGPITVTHPNMRRYFMTISEAAQLVIQASSISRGGETFVLDMGVPVKIADLARKLILLSGLRPEKDIRIEFVGVRPGEKLFEELSTQEESTLPTGHEKIRVFRGDQPSRAALETHLDLLRRLCQAGDVDGLVLELKEIVPEYNPSAHLLKQVLSRETPAKAMGVGA